MESLKLKIKVFPKDRKVLKKKKKPFEEQTIVAETSNGILYYYHYIFKTVYGIELETTSFKAHVTINNGKEPLDIERQKVILNTINNKTLTVKYNTKPYILWKFVALEVESEELINIRQQLNLSDDFKFHITIGKIKDKCLPITDQLIERKQLNVNLTNIKIKR